MLILPAIFIKHQINMEESNKSNLIVCNVTYSTYKYSHVVHVYDLQLLLLFLCKHDSHLT